MDELAVDIMLTGSQKALACPPGISLIVLSSRAVERVNNRNVRSMYFDLKNALKNGERGQTPFTPAVGILLQINARLKVIDEYFTDTISRIGGITLKEIEQEGGVKEELKRIAALAADFRNKIKDLPVDICSESLSNAVTPLATRNCSAYNIFTVLKDEYGIWVCPNGGELADKIFRVGHIGCLTFEDNQKLIQALHDLQKRGILK